LSSGRQHNQCERMAPEVKGHKKGREGQLNTRRIILQIDETQEKIQERKINPKFGHPNWAYLPPREAPLCFNLHERSAGPHHGAYIGPQLAQSQPKSKMGRLRMRRTPSCHTCTPTQFPTCALSRPPAASPPTTRAITWNHTRSPHALADSDCLVNSADEASTNELISSAARIALSLERRACKRYRTKDRLI
jgi:hypothetical protein